MDTIDTSTLIIGAVVVLVIIGLIALIMIPLQRTRRLKNRFGPEYDRALERLGDKRKAEDELEERLAHVEFLNIRDLSAEEVNRYTLEWQSIQAEFVDQPLDAVRKADKMIKDVMSNRGYPVDDFEQRAADISVNHADLVTDYRELHEIATRGSNENISTEEMRQAMVRGRELFESLVQTPVEAERESERR